MKSRKLRIAWSVIFGVAAAAVFALWVRSYWRADTACYQGSAIMRMVVSQNGVIYAGDWYQNLSSGWKFGSAASERIENKWDQLAVAYFDERPRDVCIAFPHWLLLLPLAILAVAPWINWHFSVRTLLMITTAVAALLGLVAWGSR